MKSRLELKVDIALNEMLKKVCGGDQCFVANNGHIRERNHNQTQNSYRFSSNPRNNPNFEPILPRSNSYTQPNPRGPTLPNQHNTRFPTPSNQYTHMGPTLPSQSNYRGPSQSNQYNPRTAIPNQQTRQTATKFNLQQNPSSLNLLNHQPRLQTTDGPNQQHKHNHSHSTTSV